MLKNIFKFSNTLKQISKNNQFVSIRKMSEQADDVIFETVKDKGIITLNRPKALNALNLSMVKKITPTLLNWEQDKKFVIVKGAGGRAFCSGGDVKSIVIANRNGEKLGQDFFKLEYTMNGIIGTYKIPYIAFIDGIVMGGGVGLSIHGQYRIATERTMFAMPETQIGLFPDVGTSYFLPRLGGKLGTYLALTGHRLIGYDTLKTGIATHYVNSNSIPELEKKLLDCYTENEIKDTLKNFSETKNDEFSLAPYLEKIESYFGANTVEEILEALKKDDTEWAQKTYDILLKMSPTSMKVTLEILKRGSKLSLHECLRMEYNVAYNTLNGTEFNEGVRALLIDKDQSPKWNPSSVDNVPTSVVEKHFTSSPEGIKDFRNKL